jgi:endonuclease/exonuclease/phosphatase family metal-dependent hydrolase
MNKFRIATYNIHKCVGIDRKFSPERIVDVLEEIDADVIALQEVLCHKNSHRREDQGAFIAAELGLEYFLGENRRIHDGLYGNVVLSRLPVRTAQNFDISVKKREPRGCLRAEIMLDDSRAVQFFNVHLGTSYFERRRQVHKLLAAHVLDHQEYVGHRIVAGDFNEWTKGLTTRLFKANFQTVEAKTHLGTRRTFPGIMPLLHLDHIYFDKKFELRHAFVHKSRTAMLASDHLPIVAEFEL